MVLERLDVYAVALEFLVFANEVIERLPRVRPPQNDHIRAGDGQPRPLSHVPVPVPVPVPDLPLRRPED